MQEKGLCFCGCGQAAKVGNRYIKGHNRRGRVSHTNNGKWSKFYDKCRECGETTRRHQRDGYCTACARRLMYSGKMEKKRDPNKGRWSKEHDKCVGCGTVERVHASKGLCGNCWQNDRSRKIGITKRNFGAWSWYSDSCVMCKKTESPHNAKGMCSKCYDESIRVDKYGERSDFEECSVCGVKTVKLNQHISMKSKKCVKHLKLYNKYYDGIVLAFSFNSTSKETSCKFKVSKGRVLKIWHENFTDDEIKKRGEEIRISKISGENNYLYGHPAPLISNNLIKFIDIKGRFYIMRSTWEVKYAEYLDKKEVDWEYEEHKFKYVDSCGRSHYYFPDFYLPSEEKFIEIKGYMDDKSRYKIEECSKLHGIEIQVLHKIDLQKLGIDI